MIPLASAPAVMELAFDPILRFGEQGVRVETAALALLVLAALAGAAWIAGVTPVDITRPASEPDASGERANRLQTDDLLYIAVASMPGAVVGGRLGHVLLHLDYYAANPGAIVDPGQGGLALTLGVLGGLLTGATVASLIGAPVGRWLHVSALPILFLLAGGKAVLVLGGDGQGLAADLPWATAYTGAGPWGSLAPEIASHPAQAYEAVLTTIVLLAIAALLAGGGFWRRDGRVLLLAIGLWAAGRALVAFTWRDETVIGLLRAEQLVSLAVAAVALGVFAVGSARANGPGVRGLLPRRPASRDEAPLS